MSKLTLVRPLKVDKMMIPEWIHTRGEMFACSKCNKSFKDKSDFKKHNMTHTGEWQFACSKCDISFSQSTNLD